MSNSFYAHSVKIAKDHEYCGVAILALDRLMAQASGYRYKVPLLGKHFKTLRGAKKAIGSQAP